MNSFLIFHWPMVNDPQEQWTVSVLVLEAAAVGRVHMDMVEEGMAQGMVHAVEERVHEVAGKVQVCKDLEKEMGDVDLRINVFK